MISSCAAVARAHAPILADLFFLLVTLTAVAISVVTTRKVGESLMGVMTYRGKSRGGWRS